MKVRKFVRGSMFALASGLAVLMATAATGNAQKVEFRGGAYLSDFSEACADLDWPVDGYQYANVRYRPPKLGDNGPSTRLAFHFNFWSTSFALEKGKLGKKFKKVIAGGTGSSTYPYPFNPRLRITSLSPGKITESTTEVVIAGQIRGFDEADDCDVSFRASMTKRP